MPTQITHISQCREGMRVTGALKGTKPFSDGRLHLEGGGYGRRILICQNITGDLVPPHSTDSYGYKFTWSITLKNDGSLDMPYTKLYVAEIPAPVLPPPDTPLRRIPLGAEMLDYNGRKVHGTLMGKPFSDGILMTRQYPTALYIWQNVASFGKKYGTTQEAIYARDNTRVWTERHAQALQEGAKLYPHCWFIYADKDTGTLIPQPDTEICLSAPTLCETILQAASPAAVPFKDKVKVRILDPYQLKHGMRVSGVIAGREFDEGIIHIPQQGDFEFKANPNVYVCQDVVNGTGCSDLHGFRYSFKLPGQEDLWWSRLDSNTRHQLFTEAVVEVEDPTPPPPPAPVRCDIAPERPRSTVPESLRPVETLADAMRVSIADLCGRFNESDTRDDVDPETDDICNPPRGEPPHPVTGWAASARVARPGMPATTEEDT